MRRLFLNTVDAPVARISASGTVAWYLTDRLGSVRVLTDPLGAVIDRINYDGFGNIISETDPANSDRYLWTGREFDRITGLQYNRAGITTQRPAALRPPTHWASPRGTITSIGMQETRRPTPRIHPD